MVLILIGGHALTFEVVLTRTRRPRSTHRQVGVLDRAVGPRLQIPPAEPGDVVLLVDRAVPLVIERGLERRLLVRNGLFLGSTVEGSALAGAVVDLPAWDAQLAMPPTTMSTSTTSPPSATRQPLPDVLCETETPGASRLVILSRATGPPCFGAAGQLSTIFCKPENLRIESYEGRLNKVLVFRPQSNARYVMSQT